MKRKVYVETLGCAKNQVDSEIMLGLFTEHQYFITSNVEEAEIIVVNTCGFIGDAKEESVNTILEMIQYKQEGNCEVVIVTGCLAERYADDLKKEMPEIDGFVGTTNFPEIIKIAEEIMGAGESVIRTGEIDKDIDEGLPRVLTTPNYMGYLKIAEGCDNFCTYCIIPKLRGKFRSRRMEDILAEAKKLVVDGVRELIIIAQDTTRYGSDIYGKFMLAELLKELNKIEDLKWIRLQYCYPDVIDDELIGAIRDCDKVCKYIDIPIQHCNDEVLKRMNRKTSKEQIVNVIKKLRENIPGIAIRTTLIVGFPGETDAQFEELLEFVKETKFDRLGAFAYSQEEDTAAALLDGQLDDEIKDERKDKILATQMGISYNRNEDYFDKVIEVLIEEEVQGEPIYIGRSEFDGPEIDGIVYVNTDKTLEIGSFVKVKVNDFMEYDLIGEIVE